MEDWAPPVIELTFLNEIAWKIDSIVERIISNDSWNKISRKFPPVFEDILNEKREKYDALFFVKFINKFNWKWDNFVCIVWFLICVIFW